MSIMKISQWNLIKSELDVLRDTSLASINVINKLVIHDNVNNCAQPKLVEIIFTFMLFTSAI